MSDLRKAAEKVLQENKPHGEFLEALDELRQALAQLEQDPSKQFHEWACAEHQKIVAESANSTTSVVESKALAQPEQEPVAWMTHTDGFMPLFHKTRESALNWQTQPTPLYTAPPKRECNECELLRKEIKQAYIDGVNNGIRAVTGRNIT